VVKSRDQRQQGAGKPEDRQFGQHKGQNTQGNFGSPPDDAESVSWGPPPVAPAQGQTVRIPAGGDQTGGMPAEPPKMPAKDVTWRFFSPLPAEPAPESRTGQHVTLILGILLILCITAFFVWALFLRSGSDESASEESKVTENLSNFSEDVTKEKTAGSFTDESQDDTDADASAPDALPDASDQKNPTEDDIFETLLPSSSSSGTEELKFALSLLPDTVRGETQADGLIAYSMKNAPVLNWSVEGSTEDIEVVGPGIYAFGRSGTKAVCAGEWKDAICLAAAGDHEYRLSFRSSQDRKVHSRVVVLHVRAA